MPASSYEPIPLPANPSAEDLEMRPVVDDLSRDLLAAGYGSKPTEALAFGQVRQQDAAYQGRLALALAGSIQQIGQLDPGFHSQYGQQRIFLGDALKALLRGTIALSEADWVRLFHVSGLPRLLPEGARNPHRAWWNFSPLLLLAQLARVAKKQPLQHPPLLALLRQLATETSANNADDAKTLAKIREILGQDDDEALPALDFGDFDAFARHLTAFAQALTPADPGAGPWLRLLQGWQRASGGQPSVKYLKELATEVAAIGPAAPTQLREQLAVLVAVRPQAVTTAYPQDNGRTHEHTSTEYLSSASLALAKGLLWTLPPLLLEGGPLIGVVADFAVRGYQKVPGQGPVAPGVANAALWALAQAGLPGVSALARVRGKIRQSNTQSLIAGYIEKESARLGVTPAEVEDMAAPDAGLTLGRLEEQLGDYTATLALREGKAELAWSKGGKPLKSLPAALKASHADELKELKAAQATAQQTYAAQRERLDRGFVQARRVAWPWFEQYYLHHGLLSELARRLIWRLHRPDGSHHDALYLGEGWHDAQGQPVPAPTPGTQLQLWHPVLVPAAEVLAWRKLLEDKQLRQPLKQAFREVYLLTPPEERTRTYSNRMAAHVLRQHQFNSLAKLRGWHYSLLGAYDKGYDTEAATLALPAHNLQAEYWVSEVNADDEWNDTGIYHYVATDQVRFVRGQAPVPLPDVDPLVFSEVMRDVDLFVGVASVGNDPQWRDNGGLAQYRDYWTHYSFGELGEVAKTRRAALERLVPRLKIGRVSELVGNFLEVKGHRHTYKIHIGSGNILMKPNDQYLCIVPDRSAKTNGPETGVFLPFEGDAVLSIILSKALLLMNDDQITDETILRQL